MRIIGHILDNLGHLAEVVGKEIDYNSRTEEGELDETSHMQAPGRPTKFAAKSAAGGRTAERAVLAENPIA